MPLNISLNNIQIERDESVRKLEASLFNKMAEITGPTNTGINITKSNVKFVSMEDALKELIELEKNRPGE